METFKDSAAEISRRMSSIPGGASSDVSTAVLNNDDAPIISSDSPPMPLEFPGQQVALIGISHKNRRIKSAEAGFVVLGFFKSDNSVIRACKKYSKKIKKYCDIELQYVPIRQFFLLFNGPAKPVAEQAKYVLDKIDRIKNKYISKIQENKEKFEKKVTEAKKEEFDDVKAENEKINKAKKILSESSKNTTSTTSAATDTTTKIIEEEKEEEKEEKINDPYISADTTNKFDNTPCKIPIDMPDAIHKETLQRNTGNEIDCTIPKNILDLLSGGKVCFTCSIILDNTGDKLKIDRDPYNVNEEDNSTNDNTSEKLAPKEPIVQLYASFSDKETAKQWIEDNKVKHIKDINVDCFAIGRWIHPEIIEPEKIKEIYRNSEQNNMVNFMKSESHRVGNYKNQCNEMGKTYNEIDVNRPSEKYKLENISDNSMDQYSVNNSKSKLQNSPDKCFEVMECETINEKIVYKDDFFNDKDAMNKKKKMIEVSSEEKCDNINYTQKLTDEGLVWNFENK